MSSFLVISAIGFFAAWFLLGRHASDNHREELQCIDVSSSWGIIHKQTPQKPSSKKEIITEAVSTKGKCLQQPKWQPTRFDNCYYTLLFLEMSLNKEDGAAFKASSLPVSTRISVKPRTPSCVCLQLPFASSLPWGCWAKMLQYERI